MKAPAKQDHARTTHPSTNQGLGGEVGEGLSHLGWRASGIPAIGAAQEGAPASASGVAPVSDSVPRLVPGSVPMPVPTLESQVIEMART